MKRLLSAVAILAIIAPSAMAIPHLGDASEWSSTTPSVPGEILPIGGSGAVNGDFWLEQFPGVQIGLRASRRDTGAALPTPLGGGTYFGVASPAAASETTWNYDIHIDLRGSTLTLADFIIQLAYSDAEANFFYENLQATAAAEWGLAPGDLDDVTLLQLSRNPGVYGAGVDSRAAGMHTVGLMLLPTGAQPVPPLQTSIVIDVAPIPEPATAMAVFAALAGLGAYVRRRAR